MKNEDLKKWIDSIDKKLGKENAGKIADDLGLLLTDTDSVNKEMDKREKQIATLEKEKQNLLAVNSNLLQQVGEIDEPEDDIHKGAKEKETSKPFDFRMSFDKNGEFKM